MLLIVEGILEYNIPEEKEDYTIAGDEEEVDIDIDPQLMGPADSSSSKNIESNLRLPPPPLFSRQGVPQLYKYVTLSLFKVLCTYPWMT
jgi:general transcription factor 3C polypeptide 5 (transcription factor C subunit 1)